MKPDSYERDAESGLDFAQARYDSSGLGRFMSPDPGNAGAHVGNPQSWNMYAYVVNNPLNAVDPSGLDYHLCGFLAPGGDPGSCGEVTWSYDQLRAAANGFYYMFGDSDGGWFQDTLGRNVGSYHYYPHPVPGCDASQASCGDQGSGAPNNPSGGDSGGGTGGGFTLGVKPPNLGFTGCMVRNSANYSVGGVFDLVFGTHIGSSFGGQIVAGNTFTGLFAAMAGSGEDAAGVALATAPDLIKSGMGTVTTYGRRTSNIVSLNLAADGGLPRALSPAATAGAKSFLGGLSKALNLGLDASLKAAIDGGLALAEAAGCAIPQ